MLLLGAGSPCTQLEWSLFPVPAYACASAWSVGCPAAENGGLRRADLGAVGAVATLDFGGLPYAIYADKNATLSFNNMFLTGVAYGSSYVNNTRNSPYGACSSRTPSAGWRFSKSSVYLRQWSSPCADHSQHLLAAGKYPTPGLALFPSVSSAPGANVRLPDSIAEPALCTCTCLAFCLSAQSRWSNSDGVEDPKCRVCPQLVLNNVSLTYYNPYAHINCSQANTKALFSLNGYPGIQAVAYNGTAFAIPGTSNLEVAATVAADPTAACAPLQCCHCCDAACRSPGRLLTDQAVC